MIRLDRFPVAAWIGKSNKSGFRTILQSGWPKVSGLLVSSLSKKKKQKGNPVSRMVCPWFEHRRVRMVFGANLTFLLISFSLFGSPVIADFPSGSSDVEIAVVEAPKPTPIATERRYQMPVELTGVSQGFQRYHPGVDLRAPLGSQVRPITEGVVRDVFFGSWGYGQALVIDHAEGYSSMYAHVGRIFVEPGSDVDQYSAIAEVGMTGQSTGPHLHLEIYEDGKAVNPQPFLGY